MESFNTSIFEVFIMAIVVFSKFTSTLTTLDLLIAIFFTFLFLLGYSQGWISVDVRSTLLMSSLLLFVPGDYGVCCF
jgi:hypothetical protein